MLAWLGVVTSAACATYPATPFSEARLMGHVSALAAPSLQGRSAGTDGERRAIAHVVRELDAAGIAPPPHHGRIQAFDVGGAATSANAYGFVLGATGLADEYVVLGAHVDHLGMRDGKLHAGAEDNASGVALVLEVGKALSRRRRELGRSVVLAFFGAEEIGKQGSVAYIADPPAPLERTVAMVNVDMIGLPLLDQAAFFVPKVLFGLDELHSVGIIGTQDRPGLRALVNQGCRAGRVRSVAPEDFPDWIRDIINDQARDRGDNASFEAAGIPAVFFGSGEADTYHSPDDTVDDLEPAILATRAAAILSTVIELSRADWSFIRGAPRRVSVGR